MSEAGVEASTLWTCLRLTVSSIRTLLNGVAGSNNRVALLLEDPERSSSYGDEVAVGVADLRLGGRRPAGAVDHLALAGYAPPADRSQEVHVHLYRGRPDAHQRQHREAHGVVHEGGVYTAVQRTDAVEVDVLNVDVYDRPSRFDVLDLRPYMLGEGDLLVKVPREVFQLLFAQGPYIVTHRTLPST